MEKKNNNERGFERLQKMPRGSGMPDAFLLLTYKQTNKHLRSI